MEQMDEAACLGQSLPSTPWVAHQQEEDNPYSSPGGGSQLEPPLCSMGRVGLFPHCPSTINMAAPESSVGNTNNDFCHAFTRTLMQLSQCMGQLGTGGLHPQAKIKRGLHSKGAAWAWGRALPTAARFPAHQQTLGLRLPPELAIITGSTRGHAATLAVVPAARHLLSANKTFATATAFGPFLRCLRLMHSLVYLHSFELQPEMEMWTLLLET
ncbi:uncharacterized protein LOC125443283 isoform X1 [Sphaerodactylus townsendi]|uniref:uncharacterized protein LOC125443283 isoform X1 n=1 Tax=Sphaerodactylus townsendi TaxID=933632 RepID=UPI002026CB80|nr:uncharacterized protein LOC125443283 isoform X1 [Sphaerodactylus townsendi]